MAEGSKADNDLGSTLERLEQKLQDVEAAQSKVKVFGRVMTVAVAVVAIGMVYLLLKPFISAYQNPKPYQDAMTKRVETRLVPLLKEEGEKLRADVLPIIKKASEDSREQHLPEIMFAVEQESKILVENLTLHAHERMTSFQTEFEKEQHAKLLEAFPALKDQDNAADMMERLARVGENVADRMTNELLMEHFDALVKMEQSFNELEVPEDIQNMSPAELDEHISALLLELVNIKLNEFNSKSPVAEEAS
ncbi:MAG: hypothetical protein PWP23_2345 [Candidatus Sumerlaeota bacterium]|nr:hypothetical protein [Candidatus Sumerlaeota bacterium]